MKKRLLIACMGLVLVLSIAVVAQAGPGIGAACNAAGDFGVDHDTCVTCTNPGQGNFPTCICKLIDDLTGNHGGFKNHGQCVKFFNQFF